MADKRETKRGEITIENLEEMFKEELEEWESRSMYVKTIYPVDEEGRFEVELNGVWLPFIKDNMEKLKSLGFQEGSHDAEMMLKTRVDKLPERVFD